MDLTSLDLKDNIAALTIAICYQNYITPEEALNIVEGRQGFKLTDQDKEDMYNLKQQGLTYAEIGQMYGFTDTRVFKIVKRYQAMRKKETLQGGNLAKSTDKRKY